MERNKKGQMGLDTAKLFIIGLLTLIIIGIVFIIVVNAMTSTSLSTDTITVTGETGAFINSTGYTLDYATAYLFSSPTIVAAYNYTSGALIGAGNYSLSSTGVLTNATATNWNNVSLNYTYKTGNSIATIGGNGTSAVATFFTNTTTWLALLGVVVIMLIISIVVAVVNRFGKNSI